MGYRFDDVDEVSDDLCQRQSVLENVPFVF